MVIRFVFDHTEGPIKFMLASKNPNQSKRRSGRSIKFAFMLGHKFLYNVSQESRSTELQALTGLNPIVKVIQYGKPSKKNKKKHEILI